MKSLRTALTLLFLVSSLVLVTAQSVGDKVIISTLSGSSYRGELMELDEEKAVIETADLGTITLLLDDIDNIARLSKGNKKPARRKRRKKTTETDKELESEEQENKLEEGEVYWYKNPSTTHYMFGSTGYGLKKDEIEIQSIWVVFNTVKYGVTDNLTLGAGVEILNLVFNNSNFPGFGLTAQYSFPIRPDELNVSANAAYFNYPEEQAHIGIFYGANTVGNRDSNATFGLGFIVSNGISKTRPLLNFGGMLRIGQKFSLITENWIMPPILAPRNDFFRDQEGFSSMVSFGGRHIGKNVVADFSILMDRKEDVVVPWISITIPFSK